MRGCRFADLVVRFRLLFSVVSCVLPIWRNKDIHKSTYLLFTFVHLFTRRGHEPGRHVTVRKQN